MSDPLLENWRVLTPESLFSVPWSEGGGGGVERRRGGDDGWTEPDLCCLGSVILEGKTGDLWTDSTTEDGGGLDGRLVAIAVFRDMGVCW